MATHPSIESTESAESNPIGTPVSPNSRVESIDTLRGFALLGILVMNITSVAFPFAAYFNPMVYGGSSGIDYGAWIFAHLFFDLKMMGIFSMLFGAGVVLMTERADVAGRRFGTTYYRRIMWLLVIGLIHAYLLWHGDILVTYALCGLLLYPLRRRSQRALIIIGIAVLAFGGLLSTGGGVAQIQLRNAVEEIEGKIAAGEEMTPNQEALVIEWGKLKESFAPTENQIAKTLEIMRGDLAMIWKETVHETIIMHTQAVPFFLFWRAFGMMLLGMGLMKAGVFTAQRSPAFYRNWMIVGFGLGLPLVALGIWQSQVHNFDFVLNFLFIGQFNYVGGVLVSMAYVALIMHICRTSGFARLRSRFAAVGRMALSNYLLQTIVGISLFYGYGLGLFGHISRFHLWWFILGIWFLQLVLSPWWLSRFRFGPAEWLWRSLTYWRRQEMRSGG